MIQEVVSVGLPVDERWKIIKNRIEPESGTRPDMKRICIVTGTHGDELEGQYVCYEVARRINEHKELLNGIESRSGLNGNIRLRNITCYFVSIFQQFLFVL